MEKKRLNLASGMDCIPIERCQSRDCPLTGIENCNHAVVPGCKNYGKYIDLNCLNSVPQQPAHRQITRIFSEKESNHAPEFRDDFDDMPDLTDNSDAESDDESYVKDDNIQEILFHDSRKDSNIKSGFGARDKKMMLDLNAQNEVSKAYDFKTCQYKIEKKSCSSFYSHHNSLATKNINESTTTIRKDSKTPCCPCHSNGRATCAAKSLHAPVARMVNFAVIVFLTPGENVQTVLRIRISHQLKIQFEKESDLSLRLSCLFLAYPVKL
jgi:hypothetical protein